jgi:hypothetical protein
MGDGDRPLRPWNVDVDKEGEPAAWDPENEDRLEPGFPDGGSIN